MLLKVNLKITEKVSYYPIEWTKVDQKVEKVRYQFNKYLKK